MDRFIFLVDSFTAWVGKAFAWMILLLAVGVAYEVFVRYVLRDPTSWAFDLSYLMYGSLFMMGGAYTLARDSHVRGDVIYRLWKPKTQATVELVVYFLFFFPGILALVFAGADYALESWSYNYGRGEVSINSPAGVPISQFKTVLPVAGALLFLQGLAQVCRCIVCIKTGEWPAHLDDVEEMEVALLQDKEDAEAAKEGREARRMTAEDRG
ncbi:MAG: TRAP transporter permease DctQ [Rhodospirillaceae bacterium]|jgi:TRAP-type mannitol/chloroaromatic compound transport system permease small subunit|nr:TRAP transporter permease DctQ [Rhodospirillaceae bacterium]|tara:strand:- start:2622 stop:3254 length:633 start_codon:yes stop_codon:yes gene_type:complete